MAIDMDLAKRLKIYRNFKSLYSNMLNKKFINRNRTIKKHTIVIVFIY